MGCEAFQLLHAASVHTGTQWAPYLLGSALNRVVTRQNGVTW